MDYWKLRRILLVISWICVMLTMLMHPATSTPNSPSEEEPDLLDPQWSVWSEWSPCSRTCDGGATYQTRICLDSKGCPTGRNIRYQICNMQPCPELVDFRSQQCSNYNSIPYQGKLHVWVPHSDAKSPCALFCRSLNTTAASPLIVQLAARVHDGTRCKPGSLDMCIDGVCQPVGCDLQLNSDLKIDACGVCGGDGSSCATTEDPSAISTSTHHRHHHHHHHHHQVQQPSEYQWEAEQPLTPCPVSCDGGEQEVGWACRHRINGSQVPDSLCDAEARPPVKLVRCNVDPCPPKWKVEPWSGCSVTCGGGVKERRVYCQQGRNDTKVDDVICTALIGHKVRTHEPCNTHECPQWFEGPWSECTTTCGNEGVQTRAVVCRDARGHVTNACPERDQPPTSRPCPFESRPPCPTTTQPPMITTAPNRPPRQKVTPFSLFDDDEEEEAEGEEEELKGVLVRQPGLPGNSFPSALLAEKLQVGEISLVPTDPTQELYYACGWFYKSFIVGEWGPCSVACGEGTREREVHCKIFLEFSKTIATLPDKECPGPKPSESESCFMRPCSLSNKYEAWPGQHFSDQSNYNKLLLGNTRRPPEDLRAATKMELTSQGHIGNPHLVVTKPSATSFTYAWKSSGFSQCSATCLGGVQESIIECVRESDGQRVSPHLCPMDRRPDSITRTCNDIPCPPRWNTSDFSTCTRSCGGGVQTREVHCIHEVARGGGNTLPVGADLCPQPPPRAQQFCNMIDCPVEWKVGEWSQCSSSCDGGFRVRKVTCQQLLALGQVLTKTANHCNPATKPTESKPCNTGKVCSSTTDSTPTASTTTTTTTSDPTTAAVDPAGQDKENEEIGEPHLPKILSVNQTFVQQSLMKKKVTLKIGGRATVFKGTQVKIRCPVKHYDRSKIVWMKDHTGLVKSQKHEMNKKGMIRIKDVTYSDSGVYSCIAGRNAANITLTVRPASGHNSLESDLQWETFNTPNAIEDRNGTGRFKAHGNDNNKQRHKVKETPDSWPGSLEEYEEEDEDDEDELTGAKENSLLNGKHPTSIKGDDWNEDSFGQIYSDQEQELARQRPHLTYVTSRPRTPPPPLPPTTITTPRTTTTTPYSYYDEYPESNDNKNDINTTPELIDPIPTLWPTSNWWGSIDPLRNNNNNPKIRQNYQPMNNKDLYPGSKNSIPRAPPVHSSSPNGTHKNPHYFQLLLAGLVVQQKEASSSSKRPKDSAASSQQRRAKLRNAAGHKSKPHHRNKSGGKRKHDPTIPFGDDSKGDGTVILGKGKADQLKFEWLLTPWSKCSQTCGGSGFQVRAAQCIVRLNNVTKSVEATLCEDAGLTAEDGSRQPATVQKCGMETCPKWVAGPWTPCQQSRCFTWNTALQKRPLDCVMSNGTILDPMLCSERDKPTQKRECYNENCVGQWKVSEWSHCTATCGSNGHQSRILHCVWNGTDTPAGLACADLPRLPVTRPCRGPKCPKRGQCRNQSDYCDLVQTLDLCYIPRYRDHCCQTCQKHGRKSVTTSSKRRRKMPNVKNATISTTTPTSSSLL